MEKKKIAAQLLIALRAIDEANNLIRNSRQLDNKVVIELQKNYKAIKTILNDKFDDLS